MEDLIFRCLWTLNISVGEAGAQILEGNILGTILAVLEVFRRFVWNFFRLENEHLNNCGDFRVVRDISIHPLIPSEVTLNDVEGVEPELRRHIRASLRKLSLKPSEVLIQQAELSSYNCWFKWSEEKNWGASKGSFIRWVRNCII